MNKNIEKIKSLFNDIKNKEFSKSLRTGTTGIGYTFESLIKKKEDSSSYPDYNGIEIKTKLGFSKSPLTLFCLTPNKANENSIKYILSNFGYPAKNNFNLKNFRGDVYCIKNNTIANKYIFKLEVNKSKNKLYLIILNLNSEILCSSIYWNLSDIKNRLFTKLNYLAYIKGYPYKKNNEIFYKYTSISIYKLRDFDTFLRLIKTDKIHVTFNIGMHSSDLKYGQINDRGTAFRIDLSAIEELFERID